MTARTQQEKELVKMTLGAMPWVTYRPKSGHQCLGTRTNPECKRRAVFRLHNGAAPRKGEVRADKGHYCWLHLWMQIEDHPAEYRRMVKWMRLNAPDWLPEHERTGPFPSGPTYVLEAEER